MAEQPGRPDTTFGRVLAAYAGMVRQVLDDPRRWLGGDEGPTVERRTFRAGRRGGKDRSPGAPDT